MGRTGFEDLPPLAGHRFAPVLPLRLRVELFEDLELMRTGLQHLPDQVFGQSPVIARYRQHRQDVAGLDRAEQVRIVTVLEELAGEARVGAEEQRPLAV